MKRGASNETPRFTLCAGWTLVELVVVLVVSVLLVYFAVRSFAPKQALAPQQAERLRDDLRQVQLLAMTWNQALRITVTAATVGPSCPPAVPARYAVSCVTGSATAPCNAAPVINPANGTAFSINLECGLDLAGPGFTLDIDALGRPKNGAAFIAATANFTVSGGGVNRIVSVQPITGFATAQ